MGKRYYCDYCDRSFIDDIDSRKKHLKSINHARNQKQHYNSSRDLKTLLEEESQKVECRRFLNSGNCPFDELCNFTHYSKQELKLFETQVKSAEENKIKQIKLPSVEHWLKKRSEHFTGNISIEGRHAPRLCGLKPLSLRPLTIEQMQNIQFETWG